MDSPKKISIDSIGDFYIADTGNSCTRRPYINGIITTVVGGRGQGFSGDHGSAVNALLNRPWGCMFDPSGNLYISDTQNNRIRIVWK